MMATYLTLGIRICAMGDESGDSCMRAGLRRLVQRAPPAHVLRIRMRTVLQQKLSHRVASFARGIVQRCTAYVILDFKHRSFFDEHAGHVVMPQLRGIM